MENVIWIAEDDADDLFFYKETFKKIDTGIRIISFDDGDKVLVHLSSNPNEVPRLLIVDGHMPRLAGGPLIQQLKFGNFGFPIVMITGTLDPTEKLKIESYGIKVYHKPASMGDFLILISHILSKIGD